MTGGKVVGGKSTTGAKEEKKESKANDFDAMDDDNIPPYVPDDND